MPDDRSAELLRRIVDAAYDYNAGHGYYPPKVRVGPMVAGYFLKAGQLEARIALRPGGTTLWITIILDSSLGPGDIVVEG